MDVIKTSSAPPAITGGHREIIAEWLCTHLPTQIDVGEISDNTLRSYSHAASKWLAYLAGRDYPTAANIHEWLTIMRHSQIRTSSIAVYLAAIKSLYRWSESVSLYADIARSIKSPRNRKDSPLPAPTVHDIADMYKSIPSHTIRGKRDKALLAVMYSTALRCISLVRAEICDVDFNLGTIRHQPKGHHEKDAIAVLSNTAIDALKEYLAARGPVSDTDPLFAPAGNRHSRSGHLTTKSMRSMILMLSETVGLARRDSKGKIANPGHYSAHSIRRAAVTEAAEKLGMDVAQTLAGHASVDTTRRAYARINRYRQLQATARILDF